MSSRWMRQEEAEAAGLFEGRNERGAIDGMVFGYTAKLARYLWYRGDGHTMIIAPPGSGKGQGFVLPNCILYPGSMLVIDPKGENAAMTAGHRRSRLKQEVHVIDPFGLSSQASSGFNPFDWLRSTEPKYFFEDCDLLARALVASEAAQYEHFRTEAVNLMRGLILYLFAHEPHNLHLIRLYDLAFGALDYWHAIFALMAESEYEHEGVRRIIRSAGNWYLGLEPRAKDQHRATVQKNLQWLAGLALPPVVQRSDIDFKQLKMRPSTIYLCIPGESRDLYKPYVRCLVTLLLLSMYRTRGIGALPIQFMCDEFYTTIGSLEIVDMAVGDMRGYGARFAFVFQDLSQLQKLYPDTWKLFESSCGAVIYIGADNETAVHVSTRLGDEDYIEQIGGMFFAQGEVIGRSAQTGKRPLLSPQRVKQLGPGKAIVFLQHLPPLICDRITAHRDQNFQSFLDENPMRKPALPGEQGEMHSLGSGKPMRTVDDYLAEKKQRTKVQDQQRSAELDEQLVKILGL